MLTPELKSANLIPVPVDTNAFPLFVVVGSGTVTLGRAAVVAQPNEIPFVVKSLPVLPICDGIVNPPPYKAH